MSYHILSLSGAWMLCYNDNYYYYFYFNTRNRFYWVTFKREDIHRSKFCTMTLFICHYTDFGNGECQPGIGLFTPLKVSNSNLGRPNQVKKQSFEKKFQNRCSLNFAKFTGKYLCFFLVCFLPLFFPLIYNIWVSLTWVIRRW